MLETSSAARIELTQSSCPLVQCDAWDDTVAAFEVALAGEIGGRVPARVGEIVSRGELTVVRAGPRRFWLFSRQNGSTLAAGIPADLGCRLDLSEGRIRIRVASADLRGILSKCLAVDWETTLGVATFSSLHRISVMFTRASDSEGEFVVPRSFARSIAHWLRQCAQ